jgi:hypothetical protein
MRYAAAFGRFWYDFLIGDRPELFIGPLAALALVALLIQSGWSALSGVLLFASVVASAAWGLSREVALVRAQRDR